MERTTTLGSRRTRLLRRLELIDIPGCWDRMDALGRAREQTRAKPAYASAVTVTGSPLGGALLHVLGAERPRTLLRALRSPDHACAPRCAGGGAPSISVALRNPRASEIRAMPAKMRLTPMNVPMSHKLMFGIWAMAR